MLAQAALRGAAKHGHSVVEVLKVFCPDLPDGPLIGMAIATVANEAIAPVSTLPRKYVVTCFIAIWWGAANYAPCRAMPTPCHAMPCHPKAILHALLPPRRFRGTSRTVPALALCLDGRKQHCKVRYFLQAHHVCSINIIAFEWENLKLCSIAPIFIVRICRSRC